MRESDMNSDTLTRDREGLSSQEQYYRARRERLNAEHAQMVVEIGEADDSAATAELTTLALPLGLGEEGREITRSEARTPGDGAPESEWAACPFVGQEGFTLASASGYFRAKALKTKNDEDRYALNLLADQLRTIGKKVRARVSIEARMKAAQRTNEIACTSCDGKGHASFGLPCSHCSATRLNRAFLTEART